MPQKNPDHSASARMPYYEAPDFDTETTINDIRHINKIITYIHMNIIKLHKRLDYIEKKLGTDKN